MRNKNLISATIAVAVLMIVGLACNQYGEKLEYNGGELYYTKNVTEAEAKKLGEYMQKNGYFPGNKVSYQLDKDGSTYQFRIVVLKEKQNDPATVQIMKAAANTLSRDVFNNAPVEVHICDDQFKTLQVIKQ